MWEGIAGETNFHNVTGEIINECNFDDAKYWYRLALGIVKFSLIIYSIS